MTGDLGVGAMFGTRSPAAQALQLVQARFQVQESNLGERLPKNSGEDHNFLYTPTGFEPTLAMEMEIEEALAAAATASAIKNSSSRRRIIHQYSSCEQTQVPKATSTNSHRLTQANKKGHPPNRVIAARSSQKSREKRNRSHLTFSPRQSQSSRQAFDDSVWRKRIEPNRQLFSRSFEAQPLVNEHEPQSVHYTTTSASTTSNTASDKMKSTDSEGYFATKKASIDQIIARHETFDLLGLNKGE
jgi:hypothetical protein